jgi:hypothetical protein
MNFRKMLGITLAIALCSILLSCADEGLDVSVKDQFSEKLIKFDSYESFNVDMKQSISLNLEELTKFEEARGYKSFGRKADEIYQSVNFDNFTDVEIEQFVAKNSGLLEIIDKESEMYLETKYANSHFRYVMNKNQMFQVSDNVFRVFKDGLA